MLFLNKEIAYISKNQYGNLSFRQTKTYHAKSIYKEQYFIVSLPRSAFDIFGSLTKIHIT